MQIQKKHKHIKTGANTKETQTYKNTAGAKIKETQTDKKQQVQKQKKQYAVKLLLQDKSNLKENGSK